MFSHFVTQISGCMYGDIKVRALEVRTLMNQQIKKNDVPDTQTKSYF